MSKLKHEEKQRSLQFFKAVPTELALQIFSELSPADLAVITQVSDAGKQLAADPSLSLFLYKLENAGCMLDKDTVVILRENDPPLYSELRIISKERAIKIEMTINPTNAEYMAAAIKNGQQAVIAALRDLKLGPITKFLDGFENARLSSAPSIQSIK